MNHMTLPVTVWLAINLAYVRDGATQVFERLADDRGADDSTARLLWIATGIAIAIAAGAVAVTVFNSASSGVNQSPVAPTP